MKELSLIGLGMATLDILVRAGDISELKFGSRLDGLVIDGGGMACNAMVAAQRLGSAAGFVGTFGSDRLGKIKLETLLEEGVDASRVVLRSAPDDQVVLVHVHHAQGARTFMPLAAPWRQPLAPAELDPAYLAQARYLLLDGFHMAAGLQAAQWMHAAGKQVMLDINAHHGPPTAETEALVAQVDYLVCSSGFLQALTELEDLEEAAAETLKLGPRVIVQTEGEQGSDTFTAAEHFHTPAFEVDCHDSTGAGDVFHGAYLTGLLRGWDLRRIATFSSAAAGLKCRQLGRAGYPTFAEVEQFLAAEAG